MKAFLPVIGFVLLVSAAAARDCDDECKVKPLGVVEPGCKIACEAAQSSPIPVPPPPTIAHPLPVIQPPCAIAFDHIVQPIAAVCQSNMDGADPRTLAEARALLVQKKVFSQDQLDKVEVRWCGALKKDVDGMTPRPDLVWLHPKLNGNSVWTAEVLAHEMKHVEQWERWGADGPGGFKCRYAGEINEGHGQDEKNYVEAEAYKYQREVAKILRAK